MTTAPNQRASLLSSLRTGGVRSVSAQAPSTAPLLSPSQSGFPRSSTVSDFMHDASSSDGLADQFAQMRFAQAQHAQTAAPNAHANALRLQQQMMYGMMTNGVQGYSQEEMIMLARMQQQQQVQLELMRLQALQQQAQAQAQLLALQAQHQQQQQEQQQQQAEAAARAQQMQSAGPYTHASSFDTLRSAASSAAARRASATARAQDVTSAEPMTVTLNGRFGGRLNPQASAFRSTSTPTAVQEESQGGSPPMTAGFISGLINSNNASNAAIATTTPASGYSTPPRKSDVATSWRRGSVTSSASHSPARKTPSPPLSTPTVVVSQPDEYPFTPAPATGSSGKSARRPSPLQLSGTASPKSASSVVASSDSEPEQDREHAETPSPPALSSSPTSSSPTSLSPTSAHHPAPPAPAPLEAAKRLYEGIGMGRPHVRSASVSLSGSGAHTPSTATGPGALATTSVLRQPRGPPSGAEELGVRNFASRVRRRAVSGLEVLKSARERSGSGLGMGMPVGEDGLLVF